MFGFNITSEAMMSSCWELDKNTFITCTLYDMNKKGVLNIFHIKRTFPILRWQYFKLTDFLLVAIYSPIIVHQASDFFNGFTALCTGQICLL